MLSLLSPSSNFEMAPVVLVIGALDANSAVYSLPDGHAGPAGSGLERAQSKHG